MKPRIRKRIGKLSLLLFVIYALIVIYFVLFSDRLGRVDGYDTYRYNLVPLQEIRRFITYRDNVSGGAFLLNLIGNLLVFFPIGFLIPIFRTKNTGFFRILIDSFLFTLGIELVQLFTRVGVFDVDDLLLNTLGGLLGYMAYRIALGFYHKAAG
ncbi:MAG: VanZ family protein [Eubacterium sp.]|nr:VanZ family protein [Eubacterium sp.]